MRKEFNSFKKGQHVLDVLHQPKHQEFLARMAFTIALNDWRDNPENWGYKDHTEMYEDRDNLYQYEHCDGDKRLELCYDYERYDLVGALEACYLNADYVLDCYLKEVLNECVI